MRKVKGVAWWSTKGVLIGIVQTINEVQEEKCYIGAISEDTAIDKEFDAGYIAKYGARLPLEEGKAIIKRDGEPLDFEV